MEERPFRAALDESGRTALQGRVGLRVEERPFRAALEMRVEWALAPVVGSKISSRKCNRLFLQGKSEGRQKIPSVT